MTKFKLDENLGKQLQAIFWHAGYDAETVRDENIQGIADHDLFEICKKEARCLVTLDLDFSDIIGFPLSESAGIAILRPRKRITINELEILISQLLKYIKSNSIENQLWIVEKDKIRIRKAEKEIMQ